MELPCETCLIRAKCMNTDIGILLQKCSILSDHIDEENLNENLVNCLNDFAELMYHRKPYR